MTGPDVPLAHRKVAARAPDSGEAVIEVAGCGVCHTDLSFLYQGVKTRQPPPLVLGHEISGVVRAIGDGVGRELLGSPVIVPAVLPCGECELCRAGRRTICRRQVMPGNDRDGGYASHAVVPARFLCPVPPELLATHALWELAVVSDAVSTPFQAVRRSGLLPGELAIVVGVGGIGVHAVQVAAATGGTVIALDIDDRRLEQARAAGARATLNVSGMPLKEVRRLVKGQAEALGAPPFLWKLFETSGTRPGQEIAWSLLGFGASLAVVGYTMDRIEVALSHLMAYDAEARGNWGADPLVYPEILQWIGAGRIQLKPFVEQRPLERINEVLVEAHHGRLARRAVMVPA
jgi:6-hydroxycyclohex-1-ene-1-carbonyl-CoA dehydrogenase